MFHLEDFLCTHPDQAEDYSQLKKALAEKYRCRMVDYTEGETDFVNGFI